MWRWFGILSFAAPMAFIGSASPQEKVKESEKGAKDPAPKFVGVANCKLCHAVDSTGNQYEQWKKSKHAGALKTLSTAKAKELGAKQGVADPAKDVRCLRCHVTGAEAPKSQKARTFKETDGIGCESCHGPGELYAKEEVFRQGKEAAIKAGLIEPKEAVCLGCHNKDSPSFVEFDFKKRFALIQHPDPKKKRK